MRTVDFGDPGTAIAAAARPIEKYSSTGATALSLGSGGGESRLYLLRFEPGGSIGRHVAGLPQIFLVIEGSGWAAGADGRRVPLTAGQAAVFSAGESHEKGSEAGMTVLMMQLENLRPLGALLDDSRPENPDPPQTSAR